MRFRLDMVYVESSARDCRETHQKWKACTETPYDAGVTSTKSPLAISTAGTSFGGRPTRYASYSSAQHPNSDMEMDVKQMEDPQDIG